MQVFKETVEYLGHVISSQGIHTSPKKVIKMASTPRNVTELGSFLGIVNYYGKFIAGLMNICAPLNELLWKATRWTKACEDSFNKLKQELSSAGCCVIMILQNNQSCLQYFGARIRSCIISLQRWVRKANKFCITYPVKG